MEMDITYKKENSLLQRTEIEAKLTFSDKTPSRKEIADMAAKKLGKDVNLIAINHIYTKNGSKEARVIGNVYGDANMMKIFEKVALKRHGLLEEKKEEAKEQAPPAAK